MISTVEIKRRYIIVSLVFVILFYSGYLFAETSWLKIKNISIAKADVPVSFKGFKIVFLTDIHHGPYFSLDRVRAVVDTVNKLKPDVVLLGGDYVNKDEKYIEPCFQELKNLQAKYGVYGVLGNHDHWENAPLTRKKMQEAHITCLDNKGVWIKNNNEKIKLCGIGDLWCDTQDIVSTMEDVRATDFVILISHNPDYIEQINTDKIDVMLSGHTHGGQVTFFGLWAPFVPSKYGQKYRTGVMKKDNITLIVSNGVGNVGTPIRFFAPRQLHVITLE